VQAARSGGHHCPLQRGWRARHDAAPSLRVISKHGSGTDTIDKAAAEKRGIEVVAAPAVNAAAVAEHALALLLACAKSVVALNARMHAGFWDKATHKSIELEGRTIGLIGVGAIGLRVARMAQAMGCGCWDSIPMLKIYLAT
jgi:D-3-phosphoglycerate dehydrogenase